MFYYRIALISPDGHKFRMPRKFCYYEDAVEYQQELKKEIKIDGGTQRVKILRYKRKNHA
jgi:hypothetical protein